jgi:hypothetical protein
MLDKACYIYRSRKTGKLVFPGFVKKYLRRCRAIEKRHEYRQERQRARKDIRDAEAQDCW